MATNKRIRIMTNKEIKLELAKAALNNISLMNIETVKQFYEWIVEEPEVEVETEQKNTFDDTDIREVLYIIRKNQRHNSGIATMIDSVFLENNIKTVGDLMRIGRRDFSKYRLIGKKSIWAIDEALNELGVTTW